jgi:hypothetical protein
VSYEAMLAVRAFERGRAQRTALYRHRAIANDPLAIVAFEVGAEPYLVGSIAIGTQASGPRVYVPGQPLDRQLLFAALTDFARAFCEAFERPCAIEQIRHRGHELAIPVHLPQIVVANEQTVSLLGRLGRRVAYLKTDGERPADPVLPRLGRHLMWLADYTQTPGQQLVLSVSEFLRQHYATTMSSYEAASLPALEAWINPPAGQDGFRAAVNAETLVAGPKLDPRDAEEVHRLMNELDARRARSSDPAVVAPLAGPLRGLYGARTQRTWRLIWQALEREQLIPTAPSVTRREREDRIAYAEHMAWMNGPVQGLRRARPEMRTVVRRLRELEAAKTRLEAEEAVDDPLRMVPHIIAGTALAGGVVACSANRRELIGGRNLLRPSVTVRTDEPCLIPVGSEIWWTEAAAGREWLVAAISPAGAGSDVTLVLQTNRALAAGLPTLGARVRFTQVPIPDAYEPNLPRQAPWTHRAPEPEVDDLDAGDAVAPATA